MVTRAFLAAAVGLSLIGTAYADDWPGLYMGVGLQDASADMMSIVPQDDETYHLRWSATEVGFCGDERVSAIGFETARVEGDHLVTIERLYRCEGGEALVELDVPARMWLENDGNMLVLEVPGGLIHFHRISHN